MYIVPATIKASKAVTIRGVAYTKDQTLTGVQIAAIPDLEALIAKNVLYTTPDMYGRNPKGRGKRRPSPAFVSPRVRAQLTSATPFGVSASASGLKVTLTITGGDAPYSIAWGDSTSSSVKGKTSTHTYASAGTYSVTVTGYNAATATTSTGAIA